MILGKHYWLPELHQLMIEASEILNIEAPDLYIRQSPIPNAYTLAVNGKKPFVVVHIGLVELLTRKELQWLRAAELTCDRTALLVAQDPKVVVSVLMKLAGGSPSLANQLNVDAFLEQARSYEKAASSPVGWYIRNAQTPQLSHPLPVLRAREIDEWSRSQDYGLLLMRAAKINSSKKA